MIKSLWKKRKLMFSERLTLVFIILLFLPFTYIICSYSLQMLNAERNETILNYERNVKYAVDGFNKFSADVDGKFDFISKYTPLYDILRKDSRGTIMQRIEIDRSLNGIFSVLFSDYRQMRLMIYHDNPYIYNPLCFSSIEELKKTTHYKTISKISNNTDYMSFIKKGDTYEFSVFRRYALIDDMEIYVEISISYDDFKKIIHSSQNTQDNQELYITMPDGKVFYLDNNAPILTNLVNDDKMYYNTLPTTSNCIFTGVFSKEEYQSKQTGIVFGALFFIILIGVLLIIVTRIIVISMTKGLYDVVEMVTGERINKMKYKKAEFSDEFDIIADKLLEYSEYTKRKNEEELQRQKKVNELELKVLQNMISPHFLYNTLSSIKWAYPDKDLNKLIDSMVKYYRVILNRGSDLITIEDELLGIIEYLNIQRFAYAKQFVTKIECNQSLKKRKIIKGLIQPIVENAFLHGINVYEEDDGYIKINIEYLNERDIIICVENNGILISDEIIDKILDIERDTQLNTRGSGYAIKNIIRRIKLSYGEYYGVKISNDGVTRVIITLPGLEYQKEAKCDEQNADS